MRVQTIYHVNKDFTTVYIETITLKGGCVTKIEYSKTMELNDNFKK
jgi:hypothetical protein